MVPLAVEAGPGGLWTILGYVAFTPAPVAYFPGGGAVLEHVPQVPAVETPTVHNAGQRAGSTNIKLAAITGDVSRKPALVAYLFLNRTLSHMVGTATIQTSVNLRPHPPPLAWTRHHLGVQHSQLGSRRRSFLGTLFRNMPLSVAIMAHLPLDGAVAELMRPPTIVAVCRHPPSPHLGLITLLGDVAPMPTSVAYLLHYGALVDGVAPLAVEALYRVAAQVL